ncbi:hypothetical protein MRS76_25800 [Rhizobiaceae bacterium n13]|uniref:Uncharacterized protein n=1 Tax=Ferirhizobium litorale TaxID=2927786 RepID=A0AAE3QHN6_9HYPH|nr:hypothetical protein [Fererhizobium litorale]MDI7865311.1 hypothetical protein [Fererhizobium litorale]MDI7925216.1 hypothetical protein [Fererhizobium litorale]
MAEADTGLRNIDDAVWRRLVNVAARRLFCRSASAAPSLDRELRALSAGILQSYPMEFGIGSIKETTIFLRKTKRWRLPMDFFMN